jgi:hypothetical protein
MDQIEPGVAILFEKTRGLPLSLVTPSTPHQRTERGLNIASN